MNAAISMLPLLACAFSLDAQITVSLNQLPDGSPEIRLRNDSAVNLEAFAISVNYATPASANNPPLMVYVDPVIDMFPAAYFRPTPMLTGPVLPNQELPVVQPGIMLAARGTPVFERPVAAGIFSDGSTTGDPALLTRLMLRRSNMLLAVETTLEALSDAGGRNLPRDQVLEQFRKMADSVRRWYLPPEQRVGLGLYESIIGRLTNLPEARAQSLPAAFVPQETAMLRRQRVTLLESQPGLPDWANIGR